MKVKANDLFESYLRPICKSEAQFEAINNLHKLYFESQMDKEVEVDDECCKGGKCECKGGKCEKCGEDCKDCKCGKGLNESVEDDGLDIEEEARKNGLTVPQYKAALEMFMS